MEIEFDIADIHLVAAQILSEANSKIILFYGEMGAGKTTLIKEIARAVGVKDATSSPTFSLVNEYLINDHELFYHFDMYRLNSEIEAYDMGMDEYLHSGNWCCIEWPEKVPNLIPDHCTKIEISVLQDGNRKVIISQN